MNDETRDMLTDAVMDKMHNSFEKLFNASPFAGKHKESYSQEDVHTAMLGSYMAGGTMAFKIIRVIDEEYDNKNTAKEA